MLGKEHKKSPIVPRFSGIRQGTADTWQLIEILVRKNMTDRTFIPKFQGFAWPILEAQTPETKMQQRSSE
jgi:hypothetical protein